MTIDNYDMESRRLEKRLKERFVKATACYITLTFHFSLFTIHFSLFTSQVLIHVQGGTTTIAHGEDYRCTTTHDVTTGEDLLA